MSIALSLHLLAAVIWVGGMFFAYVCLRPVAVTVLEPPLRLQLWAHVFVRFFSWVWASIITLIVTGHGMIALYGGFGSIGKHVHIMLALGYVMFLLYAHLYFAPFKRLKNAVEAADWATAGNNLNQIRKIVGINLVLGLLTVVVASAGKYLL
ncbi:CopD family protein [Alkalimarinus alittae]|uniref:CopD family protein n=1 Tax=Alkalimarinus alittae TaxID=2961619 RepID=A0ABY6N1R7_9ALTE|nr:CopD family protein [Alkalimarinus alittae]UZE96058.1 CopD family protein [Alkalimarinus alittae]